MSKVDLEKEVESFILRKEKSYRGKVVRKSGLKFQNEIAKELTALTGTRFFSSPTSGAWSTQNKTRKNAGDILCEKDNFKFLIECKKYSCTFHDLFIGENYSQFEIPWQKLKAEAGEYGKNHICLIMKLKGIEPLVFITDLKIKELFPRKLNLLLFTGEIVSAISLEKFAKALKDFYL